MAQLARSSENIDALATNLLIREATEDWIKRDYAKRLSMDRSVSAAKENRHRLIEELSNLLTINLKSFVISDGDSNTTQHVANGETHQVTLYQLIEQLNTALKAAFREESIADSDLLTRQL